MREHGEIEELLALEALGGLEPADAERLAALRAEHGGDVPSAPRSRPSSEIRPSGWRAVSRLRSSATTWRSAPWPLRWLNGVS